mmetsp:Transcript_13477/g.24747  ORF Transcript_13477/g.24747 Transcript_13477/m.24747 type:complete len:272 (+) Transcript_13477:948-1763(+)
MILSSLSPPPPSRSKTSHAASNAIKISRYTAALACPARIKLITFPVRGGALLTINGSALPCSSSLRVPTSRDMASAISGGGGMSSHRRRNRREEDGAESGSREDMRGGMDGSDRRPSCVAVSKWSGWVFGMVECCCGESDNPDEDATITKSSCVTALVLRSPFLKGNDEVDSERMESSSRRKNAETMVCLARSKSVKPGCGPTTNAGGNVLTRTFFPIMPPRDEYPCVADAAAKDDDDDCCLHGRNGRRSNRRLLLEPPPVVVTSFEYGGT